MSNKFLQVYSEPKDAAPARTGEILDKLNSLDSAEEMANAIAAYAGRRVLSTRLAHRILTKRVESGRFQDLRQVAAVTGVGVKTLTTIMHALSDDV